MKTDPKDLKWRLGHGRWYLECRHFGWAYVDKRSDGMWLATVPMCHVDSQEHDTLREAKIWAKELVVKRLEKRSPRVRDPKGT